ncbi:hypothetical protein GW17_00053372 [Ensete ventricosum]|nr:hypothetical protein GW17_00053372 [Ensete ventricosum]
MADKENTAPRLTQIGANRAGDGSRGSVHSFRPLDGSHPCLGRPLHLRRPVYPAAGDFDGSVVCLPFCNRCFDRTYLVIHHRSKKPSWVLTCSNCCLLYLFFSPTAAASCSTRCHHPLLLLCAAMQAATTTRSPRRCHTAAAKPSPATAVSSRCHLPICRLQPHPPMRTRVSALCRCCRRPHQPPSACLPYYSHCCCRRYLFLLPLPTGAQP